jgi:hypothetical protein
MMENFPQKISLGDMPNLDQNWLHKQIVANPKVLGLEGDLEVLGPDQYKKQNIPGELIIRLFELSADTRYYVHVKYGMVREEQIVSLIDGWGYERRAAPRFGHIAVLVAEEVSGLYHNALKTLNDFIPLIVIELKAYMFGEAIKLVPNIIFRQMYLG